MFDRKPPKILTMDKPSFRSFFARAKQDPLKTTRLRADEGDAEAQFSLGLNLANRTGEARDYLQAAQWYRKAADQNHVLAQFNLGVMFSDGQGVARDEAQALVWLRKAAHQGDAAAQHNLGMRCRRASFAVRPEAALESNLEAYKWFRLASAQGYRGADAACEGIALGFTREQVAEGDHRAAAFAPRITYNAPAST